VSFRAIPPQLTPTLDLPPLLPDRLIHPALRLIPRRKLFAALLLWLCVGVIIVTIAVATFIVVVPPSLSDEGLARAECFGLGFG
jgi:hypothetical protein